MTTLIPWRYAEQRESWKGNMQAVQESLWYCFWELDMKNDEIYVFLMSSGVFRLLTLPAQLEQARIVRDVAKKSMEEVFCFTDLPMYSQL